MVPLTFSAQYNPKQTHFKKTPGGYHRNPIFLRRQISYFSLLNEDVLEADSKTEVDSTMEMGLMLFPTVLSYRASVLSNKGFTSSRLTSRCRRVGRVEDANYLPEHVIVAESNWDSGAPPDSNIM